MDEKGRELAAEKIGSGGEKQSYKPAEGRRRAPKSADGHLAGALRTAYQETVQEDVPPEFLDLLGKLA